MSYILDAIKKSEAERGTGSIPGLQTVHSSSLNYKSHERKVWPYVVAALLLLNLGVMIYLLTDAKEAAPSATPTPTPAIQTVAREQVASTPTASSPEPILEPPASIPTPVAPVTSAPETVARVAPVSSEVVDINELPYAVSERIPPMQFTGHVYSSTPRQRSIIINGDFMEEGDSVDGNILLEEITRDGAIFQLGSHRFSVNVVTGWNN